MSFASHIGIDLAQYERRIRTFIPYYEEMLDSAAALLPPRAASILDLGIGTGALARRCLLVASKARVTGIDSDATMLRMARRRLGPRTQLIQGRIETAAYPRADAVVASLALHHIRTKPQKIAVFRRIYRALPPGGMLIDADCCPATQPSLRKLQRRSWWNHLHGTYTPAQSSAYLRAWKREDFYMSLEDELRMLQSCGFRVEVAWRRDMFTVIAARKPRA